jgi:hypothetical protein
VKRHPKMAAGKLQAYWHEGENDLCYNWGEGVPKGDAWMLDHQFKGLAEELRRRGYDLGTLRFSVSKEKP